MNPLEHLEPQSVFRFFAQLSAIPRGSGHTEAAADYCVAFAAARGLEHHRDAGGNVIVIKPASAGYEAAEPVILQGHLDMVCEQEPGCRKDMAREGLDLAVDGDFVFARGTTLGGDDGIAVALALALLDDDRLPHPRLEAVFTADEEIGMLGAAALDTAPLRGRTMINLDSEEEGVFTVSCAGGCTAACALPVERAAFDGAALRIAVAGLQGGHSGTEIHRGRASAVSVLGRALRAAAGATELRLVSADGGLKDNAIPTAAAAVVRAADPAAARSAVAALADDLAREYRLPDPGLRLTAEPWEAGGLPMDADATARVLCLLTCAPNGVEAMSADIPGLVQTSLNLGILHTGDGEVTASYCVRSALDSQKRMLTDRLACLLAQLGGTVTIRGDYPGWAYRADSPLRERMTEVYREQYGAEPRIEAIHAGIECGLLAGKLPGLDCVSVSPTVLDVHTPRERMSISSVQRVWRFLLEVLKRSR